MKKDYIEITLTSITVAFALLVIFLLLWKLLGSSPTIEEITLGLTAILASWLINLSYKFGKSEGQQNQFEKNVKDSFQRIREDLIEIKQKLR